MAKIKETGPHSAELVDEYGRPFAVIQFNQKTNAASRREELLDGAEHWANGGEGTPEFRLATRLRAMMNTRVSTNEDLKTPQQTVERRLLETLNAYVKWFRDPVNATARRDPSLDMLQRKQPPPHKRRLPGR